MSDEGLKNPIELHRGQVFTPVKEYEELQKLQKDIERLLQENEILKQESAALRARVVVLSASKKKEE